LSGKQQRHNLRDPATGRFIPKTSVDGQRNSSRKARSGRFVSPRGKQSSTSSVQQNKGEDGPPPAPRPVKPDPVKKIDS
jgi:hypothetical protein